MRIFFSVGEPSGDLHGANLIRRLKSRTDAQCVGFGGPKMKAAGCELKFDLTTMAVMFIGEAIRNIRLFFRLIGEAEHYFANNEIDAVVLIDYPGFNWWIARKAKKHGIPVFYYGVPQMWAWASWRIRKIRKFVDHVLCKLPFEADWFEQRGCKATYVGHPYFDQLESQTYDESFLAELAADNRPLLTLLPGSRSQEVKNVLPVLLDTSKLVKEALPHCRIIIASYNDQQKEMAEQIKADCKTAKAIDIEVMANRTPELMKSATACIACSGSVSMELLHYRCPSIIVFKIKRWAMLAQAVLLKTKFITLVNLIATSDIKKKSWGPYDPDTEGAETVLMPEYLTTGNPSASIAKRAIVWLTDQNARNAKAAELDVLASRFAIPGATNKAADYLLNQLGVTTIQSSDLDDSSNLNSSYVLNRKIA
jgi:lipid-A-disaccharide synthase